MSLSTVNAVIPVRNLVQIKPSIVENISLKITTFYYHSKIVTVKITQVSQHI